MTETNDMIIALRDLVDALHLQAEHLDRLTKHVEGQTAKMPAPNQIPLVLSSLTELQVRLDQLQATSTPRLAPSR